MLVIQEHYKSIGREPSDIELETLAQTWSEHNVHKTFKAKLFDHGQEKEPLYKRLKETSSQYFKRVGVTTAFADNSGGINFYDGWSVIGKGETHNSPVAVEPFGGAATKNGGVYRDIVGTGQGGENILSVMVNNFASPFTPKEEVKPGCLHPRRLLLENSRGERSYGNEMGIPTHGIVLHFHPDFGPKPTSMGIAIGIIPNKFIEKGTPLPGDLLVTLGGRTGRDGVHGATFSSGAMTHSTKVTHSTSVQIGDSIQQKKCFDALKVCRDEGVIRAITDCGGGGYSSAIGEIGSETGVEVHLDKVPLKYPGLSPWEIWLSESQERMIIAIDPKNRNKVSTIAQQYQVEATVIGEFTNDHKLSLKYQGELVGELDMEFLHDGLPQREMQINFVEYPEDKHVPALPTDWNKTYQAVLSHLNVCSKELMHRQYDQTNQGRTVLQPYSGIHQDVPNDATVVAPLPNQHYGIVTAVGLNPILNRLDPYWGSVWAVAQAASKYTAVGGDINQSCMIDNFVWPFPDEKSLGDLDRSVDALCDAMNTLRIPWVSGKDSLSSTYRGPDGTVINIPPVLNLTVFGRIPDVRSTVTADFKKTDSAIYLVGHQDADHLGGSAYFDTQDIINSMVPQVQLKSLPETLHAIYMAIQLGKVLSAKAIGEGGLATALAMMCFGGDCGAQIDLSEVKASRPDFALFNETAGCFLVELNAKTDPASLLKKVPYVRLGTTVKDRSIRVSQNNKQLFSTKLDPLKAVWQQPMKEILTYAN
jgi:phosphoribosylformylglycinamidine synthase subunit PurSL